VVHLLEGKAVSEELKDTDWRDLARELACDLALYVKSDEGHGLIRAWTLCAQRDLDAAKAAGLLEG